MNLENAWMWLIENAPNQVIKHLELENSRLKQAENDLIQRRVEAHDVGMAEMRAEDYYGKLVDAAAEVIRLRKECSKLQEELELAKGVLQVEQSGRIHDLQHAVKEEQRLCKLVVEVADWNWLDEDSHRIPAEVRMAVMDCEESK